MEYEFDYEVNSIKLDSNEELNTKMYFLDKKSGSYRIQYFIMYRNCKLQLILGQPESRVHRRSRSYDSKKKLSKSIMSEAFKFKEKKKIPNRAF